MSTIDRAALIEQAVRASWEDDVKALGLDSWDELDPEDREAISAATRIALPVIAKALLARLRKLHPGLPSFNVPSGIPVCSNCGQIKPCSTERLLDAIEAEVQP